MNMMRSPVGIFESRKRLMIVMVALALAATALIVRAVDLQIISKAFYQDQGAQRHLRDVSIAVSRGTIFDRNGVPLAVSTPVVTIWANPKILSKDFSQLPALAKLLEIDAKLLRTRIEQKRDKQFVYLKRHLSPDLAEKIVALEIDGVEAVREFRRFYPASESASQIIGFTNIDDKGQEGLELAFNSWLTGKQGFKRVIKDMKGGIVENVELLQDAQSGRDLTLSMDRRIQYLAYRELKSAVEQNQAAAGSMVIIDIPTGEVLAMANYPAFNPNSHGASTPASHRNRAATDLLEPGSVFKVLTVAAGLESGRFTPTTVIDTYPGTMRVHNHIVRDIRNFGSINPTRLLTKSSNIAAAKIALSLDDEYLHDMFERFGVGRTTESGFPGEASGTLTDAAGWGDVEKATMSYGYGISMTPLQLATIYAAIGNGGRLRAPTFVRDQINPDRAVLDPAIAKSLLTMLETVTTSDGGGTKAAVANYRVAGKTGTARKASRGGYQMRYNGLFAGLMPASNPRLAAVVVINDPRGKDYYGGLIAAPVFSKVMSETARLLNLPPDDLRINEGLMAAMKLDSPSESFDHDVFAEGVTP